MSCNSQEGCPSCVTNIRDMFKLHTTRCFGLAKASVHIINGNGIRIVLNVNAI